MRNLLEASPWQGPSLWLSAVACMIIIIFAASLAQASPAPDGSLIVLAKSDISGVIDPAPPPHHAIARDSVSENEQDVLSAPLPPPMYHDRYDFYHRYDHYRLPSRLGPLDDGID
jgi:hypothetical protein